MTPERRQKLTHDYEDAMTPNTQSAADRSRYNVTMLLELSWPKRSSFGKAMFGEQERSFRRAFHSRL